MLLIGSILCAISSGLASEEKPATSNANKVVEMSHQGDSNIQSAKKLAEHLYAGLEKCKTDKDRVCFLLKDPKVQDHAHACSEVELFLSRAQPKEQYLLYLVMALGQYDTLFFGFDRLEDKGKALQKFTSHLLELEEFYQPIGGVLGYHLTVLRLLLDPKPNSEIQFFPPPCIDLRKDDAAAWQAAYDGIVHLGSVAQMLVIGGAADRLHLVDPKSAEPLPAAYLMFCGRTMLEGLMRDIEALEHWHYKTFGKQIEMPILMMTSMEKHNDHRIEAICTQANWFGRTPSRIRRLLQPLVPLIDTEGCWVASSPLTLMTKPGGHGVIWKLAHHAGAFQWLKKQGISSVVVRQINNPLAGLDLSLSPLIGYGIAHHKSFGFASCPSKPGFSEGLNILAVQGKGATAKATISNIEYTQFSALKKELPHLFTEGVCPANTNILFADIAAAEKAILLDPVPGVVVNAKTAVETVKNGVLVKTTAARLESSMQNLADSMQDVVDSEKCTSISPDALSTFLILRERSMLMSVAKKAFQPDQSPYETPESCFYDWNMAMRSLLEDHCSTSLPKVRTLDEFLRDGPEFTFTFHPALGPFWDVIGQKISHGSIAQNSDIELEISEISMKDFSINGSFRIRATSVTGSVGPQGRSFHEKVGRARLHNITVKNKGCQQRNPSAAIQNALPYEESCSIFLEGFSEVSAEDVSFDGPFSLVVPNGKRAIITQSPAGKISVRFEPISAPTWRYSVSWSGTTAPILKMG